MVSCILKNLYLNKAISGIEIMRKELLWADWFNVIDNNNTFFIVDLLFFKESIKINGYH